MFAVRVFLDVLVVVLGIDTYGFFTVVGLWRLVALCIVSVLRKRYVAKSCFAQCCGQHLFHFRWNFARTCWCVMQYYIIAGVAIENTIAASPLVENSKFAVAANLHSH